MQHKNCILTQINQVVYNVSDSRLNNEKRPKNAINQGHFTFFFNRLWIEFVLQKPVLETGVISQLYILANFSSSCRRLMYCACSCALHQPLSASAKELSTPRSSGSREGRKKLETNSESHHGGTYVNFLSRASDPDHFFTGSYLKTKLFNYFISLKMYSH